MHKGYIIDANDPVEIARLNEQYRLFLAALGGILPEQSDLSSVKHVLDIGCGAGAWALDVAFAYPKSDVIGIDINPAMVNYAMVLARVQQLENVTFEVIDAGETLDFKTGTFDLINACFAGSFLTKRTWPLLLAECLRLLRPGGILRVTECEITLSNSHALHVLNAALYEAFHKQGRSFSRDGHSLGTIPILGRLLLTTGFHDLGERAFSINTYVGNPLFHQSIEAITITFALLRPYLIESEVLSADAFDAAYSEMAQTDMYQETFSCITFGQLTWAKKPPALEKK